MTTKLRIVFFDLETRRWAADLDPEDLENGWDQLRAGHGGASAIALYDTRDNWLYLYDDHTVETAARHLEAADLVVGYCSSKFDVPCIEGLLGRRLRLKKHIDLYIDLTHANTNRGIISQKGDMTLDRIARKNLGHGKIGHGSNARELARQGRYGELFNYCSDDVHLTHDLYMKMVKDGGLVGPRGFVSLEV